MSSTHPMASASGARGELRVTAVRDEAGFAALHEAWNGLVRRSCSPSLFLTHEWFGAAWAWRRFDASLHILVARDAAEDLVAILPLIVHRQSRIGARRLELLTVPDTQSCDVIVASPDVARAAEAFAAHLAARRDWDILELDHLGRTACADALSRACAERGLHVIEREAGRNHCVDLGGTWAAYYATRSRSLKKANNLAANRLKKAGAIRIERVAAENTGDLARALADAVQVSTRSWKRETETTLDRPGPGAFIASLTASAALRGWLSLWLLYLDDRPVAMEYQLVDGANVHALRADFDAACEETSPGSHLFRQLLEALFDRGLGRYYMGRGDNPYKQRWTDQGEPVRGIVACNATVRGRYVGLTETLLKPAARALRARYAGAASNAARTDKRPPGA